MTNKEIRKKWMTFARYFIVVEAQTIKDVLATTFKIRKELAREGEDAKENVRKMISELLQRAGERVQNIDPIMQTVLKDLQRKEVTPEMFREVLQNIPIENMPRA